MKSGTSLCIIVSFAITGLLVLSGLSAGCLSAPVNQTADEVAGKFVQQQEATRDFSAIADISMQSYPGHDRYLFEKKTPQYYRIEYLSSGSEPNGTLFLTNGSIISWYSPIRKSVRTTEYFDPEYTYFTQRDYTAMITGLFNQYPGSVILSRIDHENNSYVMEFSAPPDESFTNLPYDSRNARIWIENGTWVIKKIEFFNDSLSIPMTIEYQNIQVNRGIPDSRFVFDPVHVPNPPVEFRHHDPVLFLETLENAYSMLGNSLVVPGYVPDGFSYDGGHQSWDGILYLSLSDGKRWIGFSDSPIIGKPYVDQTGGETVRVALHRNTGRLTTGNGIRQLEWISDGHAYSLTGTVSEEDIVRMATSLVHVDDQLIKTLPANELRIAKPLAVTELTSIIMPESFVRSHNTSTTPGIIDIRLTASEFNKTFVRPPQYPDFLVYERTGANERVIFYQIPKTMFEINNPDPLQVRLNHPESMFRSFPNLKAVFEDRCRYDKIPCPDGEIALHE